MLFLAANSSRDSGNSANGSIYVVGVLLCNDRRSDHVENVPTLLKWYAVSHGTEGGFAWHVSYKDVL